MDDLRNWVETAVGGAVVGLSEVGGGRSRLIWAVDLDRDGERLPLLVRQETGFGSHSGTRFTIRREAATLRALEGRRIPAPRIYAVADDAIIMQRLAGDAAMPQDPETRRRAVQEFARCLADLHRLDIATIDAPFPKPAGGRDDALLDLADYEDSYRRLCVKHPIIDRAFEWLRENVPPRLARSVLVHGDAGPGNFMHDHGRLTGLIDWEMTHFGDPHDDLAWIWFRVNMIRQDLEADSYFQAYREASELQIDRGRLIYYAVQVILRCAVACGVRQFHDPAHDDTRPRQLRDMLEAALADAQEGRLQRLPPLPAGC